MTLVCLSRVVDKHCIGQYLPTQCLLVLSTVPDAVGQEGHQELAPPTQEAHGEGRAHGSQAAGRQRRWWARMHARTAAFHTHCKAPRRFGWPSKNGNIQSVTRSLTENPPKLLLTELRDAFLGLSLVLCGWQPI